MTEKVRRLKDEPRQASFLDSLVAFDVIATFRELLEPGGGFCIDPLTKKISPIRAGLDWQRTWIFVNPDHKRKCDILQSIFLYAKFIPSKCLDCWKVVVKMPTVAHLLKMWSWQKQFSKGFEYEDRFCKCGIEERRHVTYPYGAYFYCDSKDQALQRFDEVLAGMQEIFGAKHVKTFSGAHHKGHVEVIMKRYCTEFEIKLGPSDKYERTANHDLFEEKIINAFDMTKPNITQPDYVIEHVLREWLEFAYDRGDMTCLEFNNGEAFYSPVVTYHLREE